jgi:membrane protease subunit HflK
VIDAFRDVQAARQDQDRLRNEAETYASRVVPEARGRATTIIQEAEAYKERAVNEAQGGASRFNAIHEQYRKAPEITRQRMFLETMEHVLGPADKLVIDQAHGGPGVIPYLPLDQFQRRSGGNAQQGQVQGQAQGATR